MHCLLTSKAKINFFKKISSGGWVPKAGTSSEEKISKTLILVFEVIINAPKHTFFDIFICTRMAKNKQRKV